jgi:hypothetical protein
MLNDNDANKILEHLLDVLSVYGLEVKCPTCRKWTASYFTYDGLLGFRCGGCRKLISHCHCRQPDLRFDESRQGKE